MSTCPHAVVQATQRGSHSLTTMTLGTKLLKTSLMVLVLTYLTHQANQLYQSKITRQNNPITVAVATWWRRAWSILRRCNKIKVLSRRPPWSSSEWSSRQSRKQVKTHRLSIQIMKTVIRANLAQRTYWENNKSRMFTIAWTQRLTLHQMMSSEKAAWSSRETKSNLSKRANHASTKKKETSKVRRSYRVETAQSTTACPSLRSISKPTCRPCRSFRKST